MRRLLLVLLGTIMSSPLAVFAANSCDFDADGMSEFVVVNSNGAGYYDWQTFNPRSGRSATLINGFGNAASKLIPGNWVSSDQAVAAIVDPVSAGPSGRATWSVKSNDQYGGSSYSYSRKLGRPGDIIILGGDYDGNGITDSLILKQTTGKLGLRVNYFLSSYNGNNLGKERLYKALGAPFRDKNFFVSPDGNIDYLGVIQKSAGANNRILLLKPFTDSPSTLSIGALPAGAQGPLALKQSPGHSDFLAFYTQSRSGTNVVVKNLSGSTVGSMQLHGNGSVLVGDYLADRGYEIAVQGSGSIEIYNPNTKKVVAVTPPSGMLVGCVSNQYIQ